MARYKKRGFDIGNWRTQDEYAVVGEPQDFYVYFREGRGGESFHYCSDWIRGDMNLWHKLKRTLKDKHEFIREIKTVYYANLKKD